ncbi:MAG: hypothetical protein IJU91_02365 [Selenomonadaceae bacterium]|nr:hypothetical protein [Selenomonadaceae bacterium]
MRVIVLLKDDATFKNLLPYLNESAEIIFVDENNHVTDKNFQPLPYQNIAECLFASKWDYILTQGNFIVKQLTNFGIDPARIIDVDFILNDDYVKKVFLAVALRNKISNFESVIVGDFAAAMGFNADEFLVKTANLASSLQDLKTSYLWLKAALTAPKSKIKYAVIGLSPHALRYDLSLTADKWESLSYYSIFKGQMNFPLTDDAMSALFDENFLNVYALSNVNYAAHANQYAGLNFADPLGEKQLNNHPLGQESVFGVRSDARRWDADKYFHAAQSNAEIFMDCLKLCRDNDVTPIVVKLPVHAFYKSLFPAELTAELDAMLYRAKKVTPFKLIDAFAWNLQNGEEFCRMDALNSIGAKRVTVHVNALIEKLHAKKIRVAFICQGGDLDKLSPVYEVMRKRDDTDVYLLAVPPYENYNLGQPFDANDERYIKAQGEILKNYGANANTKIIKTVTERGGVDLEPYLFDYVFYQKAA